MSNVHKRHGHDQWGDIKGNLFFQPTITCSKLTIATLEQGMNIFKVNNKDTSSGVLASLLLTLSIFHSLF